MARKKSKYNTGDLIKMFNLLPVTVDKRFRSKYANKRWGVEFMPLPDGTRKGFVPKDKVYLWVENTNYVGRPKKEYAK